MTALQVHRNTIIGALVHALRLTYSSVDAVVGEAFFDQTAAAFAEHKPPTTARLLTVDETDELRGQKPVLVLDLRKRSDFFRGHIPGYVPATLVTGFGSPCGMCFYEGDAFGLKYKNAPWHADAGPRQRASWMQRKAR